MTKGLYAMRRRRTALWSLLGIATVAAALTAVWRSSDLGRASADVERQRAAAKREGVPIEWSDLRRLVPPVAEEDNAAPLYAQGFAEFHAANGFSGTTDRVFDAVIAGKAKPEDVEKARLALAKDDRALGFVEAGSERKVCRFDRRWEEGPRLLLPEFSDERSAARALVLRAVLASDPSAAGRDLRAAAHLASHVGSEPILISPLVAASTEDTVERGIRAVGVRGGAWTKAARSALDAFGPLPDARFFLAGESVMGRQSADELSKENLSELAKLSSGDGTGEASPPFALRFAKLKFVRDAFEVRAIEYWRQVYAALPADPLDRRRLGIATRTPYPKGPSGALVAMLTPVLASVGDLSSRMEAGRRLTRAALDLKAGVDEPLPRDPFGEGSLKLRRDEKGWTLWSVGPDGVDQGGKSRGKWDDPTYDIVVVVPRG